MRFHTFGFLGCSALALTGCLQVLGLGDYKDGGSGGSGGNATSTTGTGNGSGTGGSGSCKSGQTQACYDGPAPTKDVGNCKSGMQSCLPDGSGFGTCDMEVLPATESCTTPGDEDCDGYPCSEVMWLEKAESPAGVADGIASVAGDGSIYFGASFSGGLALATSALASAGGSDAAVVKLGSDGSVIWSKSFGNTGEQRITGITATADGGVILGGVTDTNLDVGGKSATPGIFLAKLDGQGATAWVVSCGGSTSGGVRVGPAPNGDFVVSGQGAQGLNCGAGPVDTTNGSAFYGRFTSAGIPVWIKAYKVAGTFAVDPTGNIVSTGYFSGSASFGGATLVQTSGAIGVQRGFVVKLSANGDHLWSRAFGDSSARTGGTAVAVDPLANVYLLGVFSGQLTLGGFGAPLQAQPGTMDGFIGKLDGGGGFGWQHDIGVASGVGVGDFPAFGGDLSVDTKGSVAFGALASFNMSGIQLSERGFIAKISAAGAPIWERGIGGDAFTVGQVLSGPHDEVVTIGSVKTTITVDGHSTGCTTCTLPFSQAVFLGRLGG